VSKRNLYEAMVLVDSGLGGSEFAGVVQEISGLIKRHGGEVKQVERWSDRKLAYDVAGMKRGLYILVYFEAPPENIAEFRRDVYLTERLERMMVLRVNSVPAPTSDVYGETGEVVKEYKPEEAAAEEGGSAPQAEPAAVAVSSGEGAQQTEEVKESGQSE
jgi:small subunit ribosomal protein S6